MNIPQNIKAEISTLGSMLLAENALEYCVDLLQVDDFFEQKHRTIFECLRQMYNSYTQVDTVTLVTELHNRDQLKAAGDAGYISGLIADTPSASNVKYYAGQVRECSIRRKIIRAGHAMYKDGQEVSIPIEELMAEAEKSIFSISISEREDTLLKASEMIIGAYEHIEAAKTNKGNADGVQTGFLDLDRKIGCLRNSELIVLAARPGMGKTSLAMNIAQFAALRRDKSVVMFSLEMPATQLMARIFASEAKKNLKAMFAGELSEKDMADIQVCAGELQDTNLFIDDGPGLSIPAIRSKCRKVKAKHGLDLVIIDYLQLMRTTGKAERRDLELANITREAKLLARELNVPILMLSQLKREVESRDNGRPLLSDLRESGAIEQDADKVIFIYGGDDGVAEVEVAKHRNGPKGTVSLTWLPEYVTFRNYAG